MLISVLLITCDRSVPGPWYQTSCRPLRWLSSGTCNDLTRECAGMPIPDDDPHFLTVGVSCISLKRDTPAALLGPATPREYSNVLTSFVDASLVYGSDRNTLDALRDTWRGTHEGDTPPLQFATSRIASNNDRGFCRSSDSAHQPCFQAADKRANVNPGNRCKMLQSQTYFEILPKNVFKMDNFSDRRAFI